MSEILGIDTDNYAVQSLKSTGGGSATLQSKSVTITENGTTNVAPDTGYDGLSSVAVTTNVSGGSSVVLPDGLRFQYSNCTNMDWLAQADTSQMTLLTSMFGSMHNLTSVPPIDTRNALDATSMFMDCNNLVSLPQLDLSKCGSLPSFAKNCTKLENVPVYNIPNITVRNLFRDMYSGCPALTNESLNNILATCITMVNLSSSHRNLYNVGLTLEQATTCTTLSNWSALQAAGWTTGY